MRALLAALVLLVLAPGCGGLQREATPTVWLALEPALPAAGSRAGAPSLRIDSFATAETFRDDRLSVREGHSKWSLSAYHRWVADPGEMVASAARDHLSRAGLFSAVFTPPAPVEADYRLSGAVRRLYWDREERTAVVEVEASLVESTDRLRGFWVYRRDTPVQSNDVAGFLRSASAGLDLVLADLDRDLSAALANAPSPASH